MLELNIHNIQSITVVSRHELSKSNSMTLRFVTDSEIINVACFSAKDPNLLRIVEDEDEN